MIIHDITEDNGVVTLGPSIQPAIAKSDVVEESKKNSRPGATKKSSSRGTGGDPSFSPVKVDKSRGIRGIKLPRWGEPLSKFQQLSIHPIKEGDEEAQ